LLGACKKSGKWGLYAWEKAERNKQTARTQEADLKLTTGQEKKFVGIRTENPDLGGSRKRKSYFTLLGWDWLSGRGWAKGKRDRDSTPRIGEGITMGEAQPILF